jgi:hypothetical protein
MRSLKVIQSCACSGNICGTGSVVEDSLFTPEYSCHQYVSLCFEWQFFFFLQLAQRPSASICSKTNAPPKQNACTTKRDSFILLSPLSQSPSFTFRLEQAASSRTIKRKELAFFYRSSVHFIPALSAYNVAMESFRTWALDVANDASGGIVHKLSSNLRNTFTRTYKSQIFVPLTRFSQHSLLVAYQFGPRHG